MSTKTTAPKSADGKRIGLLDELRGFAVACMILYHGFYLFGEAFGFAGGVRLYEFFMPIQPLFAGLFIAISGISSRLSRSNALRGVKLLGIALGITLVTAVLLPLAGFDGFPIYFGILHCLSLCMLLFAAARPALNVIPSSAGLLLCIVLYALTMGIGNGYLGIAPGLKLELVPRLYELPYLFPFGIRTDAFFSADYFPLIPNVFVFLAGTYLGIFVKAGRAPQWSYKTRVRFFAFLGKHALLVYVLHMPVIFVLASAAAWLAGKF